jgi:sterol desaturase/sphingolipid hydroxylase (fatty acid hydroxylase superfamily)
MVLLVPSAAQCLAFAGPFLAIGGIVWFWRNGDMLITRLFPQLKWERELGWLNLRAERRADRILQGLTHVLHLMLLGALAGILGLAWLLGQPHDMNTIPGAFSIPFEFIYLALFVGLWIYYFIAVLGPRVSAEFEEKELQRWRRENPDTEREPKPKDRLKISLWETERPRRRF